MKTRFWKAMRPRSRFPVSALLWMSILALMSLLTVVAFAATFAGDPTFDRTIVPVDLDNISGISFDGKDLWITVDGGGQISRVDPQTGQIEAQLEFAIADTGGSAWDGEALWQLAYAEGKIYRIDLKNGAVLAVIPTPGEGICSGMTYDGTHLWLANVDDEKLYRIDPRRGGEIVETLDSDFETTGLAWDGRHLWNGVLVGTSEDHDAPAPYTGFVQQRDLRAQQTLRVLPVQGVFAGSSDWMPGTAEMTRMWWYDGYHGELVQFSFKRRSRWQGFLFPRLFQSGSGLGDKEVA